MTIEFRPTFSLSLLWLYSCLWICAVAAVSWGDDPHFGRLLSPELEVAHQSENELVIQWKLPGNSEENVLYALLALPGPIESATQSVPAFQWKVTGATPQAGDHTDFKEKNPKRTGPRIEIHELGQLAGVRIASLQLRFYYSSASSNTIAFPEGSVRLQFNRLDPVRFDSFPKEIKPLADQLLLNHASRKIAASQEFPFPAYLNNQALKVYTAANGLHRLPAEYILNSFAMDIDVSRLALLQEQHPIPRAVLNSNGELKTKGQLAPMDEIVFYAPASKSAFATETATWLMLDRGSTRDFEAFSPRNGAIETDELWKTTRFEKDKTFIDGKPTNEQQDDYWVWADLISQATPSILFSIEDTPRSSTASLEMKFYISKGTPREFIHSVTPYMDGRRIDWTATSRADVVLATATLSSQWLHPGAHEFTFDAPPANQLQSKFESINLDWFQFQYAALVRPSTLAYQTPDNAARIEFSEPSCALWLPNDASGNSQFAPHADAVYAVGSGRLFVVNQQQISDKVRMEFYDPSTPDATELMNLAQTDVILVAPSAWRDTLTPYRESLMRMGYTVRIASIEAIYDCFGDGRLSPFALREFLRYAYRSWKRPSPSYVLLIGDATWDYKNRYGLGVKNYIPGYRGMPEYAVENWYVRLDDDTDKIPDMMIGRWPLRSADELKTLIDKTIRYKESLQPEDWLNHYFLLTDHGFERFTEELEREWIPKGFRLTQRHVADYPLVDNIYLPEKLRAEKRAKTSLAATRDIINTLNNGVWLMEFFGHGAPNVVGNERLFFGGGSKFTDVKKLTNSDRPFLFWSFSCETSKFDYPRQKWNISIGEDMLTHPNGGAVGLLGASGRGYPHDHIVLARGMHEALYHYGLQSMGQILMAGNLMGLAYQNVFEPADQFCFLGDPTIRMPQFESLNVDAQKQQNEISLSATRPSSLTNARRAAVWIRSGSDVIRYATLPATDRVAETFDATDEDDFYAGAEFISKRDGEIIIAHGADYLSQTAPPIIEATTGILPDLIIQPNSLRVSPDAPRSGETLFLDGVITNQGQATAQDIFVQGQQAPLGKKRAPFNVVVGRRGEQIERLDPGESARVRLRWDPTGNKGDYDLELDVDPFKQIEEENEDNNSDETQVTVLRKADLLVEQDHFKLTPIDGGKRYQVSFSIWNAGECTVDKFLIEMAYQLKGSSKRLSGFVPEVVNLDPGQRYNAGGIKVPANIEYFELVIDPDELVDEETHDNNTFRYTVN